MPITARFMGVDVSHYQGGTFPWQWCVDQGAVFGATKMTDGTANVDWTGPINRAAMHEVGLRWIGLYHYARAGDPVGNAHHFQDSVGELTEHEHVFLDVESGMDPTVAAVVAMLEAFEAIYPGRVADYQGHSFASGDSAAYDPWPWFLPAFPWPNQILPVTTRHVTLWQYAGGAHGITVPGTRDFGAGPIPIGNVDSDMVLDPATMDALSGLQAPPEPTSGVTVADCINADTQEFWRIWDLPTGKRVAAPFSDLEAGGDWVDLSPINDILNGPVLKPVPGDLLEKIRYKPEPTPAPATLVPHHHEEGATGPAIAD